MMLTEPAAGAYVNRRPGYDRLDEILHSTGSFNRIWSRRRSALNPSEPVRHTSYRQIALHLNHISPARSLSEFARDLNLLSILKPRCAERDKGIRAWSPVAAAPVAHHHRAQRQLIAGIAHLFNDLLMGIQGNVTLIHLSLNPDHPWRMALKNTEELVHAGSLMINLLLEYLAERRTKLRQTRFGYLIGEISGADTIDDFEPARRRFEQWIDKTSKYEALAHIAENCARTFEQLIINMTGCLEQMGWEVQCNATTSERIKKINALTKSVNQTSEKLFRFAGTQPPTLKPVSIIDLLNERLDVFGKKHEGIRLKKHVSHALPAIQADSTLVADAIDQVLQNSADSMPAGGCLTVRAKRLTFNHPYNKHSGTDPASYVMIEIADTGIGIGNDVHDRIFDPFFTTKPHGKGHGLGLSTAMGTCRMHGGFIDFNSEPAKGSCFKLYLP